MKNSPASVKKTEILMLDIQEIIMPRSFSSPNDFMSHVQVVYKKSMVSIQSATPNLEFQKISEDRIKEYGIELRESGLFARACESYDLIVKVQWEALQEIFPARIVDEFNNRIAVGSLDNMFVNALCATSEKEGYIAIVINSGLMCILSTLSKMLIALNNPASIRYCNRASPSQITRKIIEKWISETCENYCATGKPIGPQIHLNDDAEILHGHQLFIWEMYILSHEVSHVLCNHLNNNKYLLKNSLPGMIDILSEDTFHEMEEEADFLGYLLLRERVQKATFQENQEIATLRDDRGLVVALIELFDLFHMLGFSETSTHPHPLVRLVVVLAKIYGKPLAYNLIKSYDNNDLIDEVLKNPLIAPARIIEDELSKRNLKAP